MVAWVGGGGERRGLSWLISSWLNEMLECTLEWEETPPQFLSTNCDPGLWTEDIGEGKPEILWHQKNPDLTDTHGFTHTRRCQIWAGSAARDVGHEDLTVAAAPGPPHHPMAYPRPAECLLPVWAITHDSQPKLQTSLGEGTPSSACPPQGLYLPESMW